MYKKLSCCKYCQLDFQNLDTSGRANHSRWCTFNPKSKEYREQPATQLNTKESIQKRNLGIKLAHANGKYTNSYNNRPTGWKHSAETIELIKQKALASTHRRLVRSMREYIQVDGSKVMLDSSWEELLAERLDLLDVRWIRPKEPLKWIDSNMVERNYFPDFYLIDYDIFLDPKNPFAAKVQKEKLDYIKRTYNNVFFLDTEEMCKKYNVNGIL